MTIQWHYVRWLLLYMLHIEHSVLAVWPTPSTSNVTLLGLFPDAENGNETTELSVHSRAMFKAAVMLSQQDNITVEDQLIQYQSVLTSGDVINVLSETCQAVSSSNILGIIGPAYSRDAHQVATFAKRIGIPIISYSATDPALSDRNTYPTFHRTVPSDNTTAFAITKLFLRYNWTSCIIIHQNDAFGEGGAKIISETFTKNNLSVTDSVIFDIATLRIKGDLRSVLRKSAARIVILWVSVEFTELVLQNALDADVVGPQFTWIISSTVPLTSFNRSFHEKLIGMVSVEPITRSIIDAPINTTLLSAAYQLWQQYEPETCPDFTDINPYALFAFDATWTLIQSLQKLCATTENQSCLSFTGSSYCYDRRFVHSNSMLNIINSMEFLGVSGPLRFTENTTDRINGLYYYAQNIQSNGNDIYFTPVLKYAHPDDWTAYSSSGTNLIFWPGNTLTVPTDRAILAGVTLRIGVFESPPFTMTSTSLDSSGKNVTKLVGYVPQLIEELRSRIKFIPDIQLATPNTTYNQLVQAVANGVYDIVVADLKVTSVRRELVGFSSPMFDEALCLMTRKELQPDIDLLSYLKPFSRNLWLLVLGACIVASIIFYLLEKGDNESLNERSIPSAGVMSFWYSLGTVMGYGVEFSVRTAAGRLLTVGLYMLSLILLASYTANLASDLTIKKSKGIIDGIEDLKKGKIPLNRVGVRTGTADEEFFLREVSNGNRNYYPLSSRKHLYDSLLAGIIDVAVASVGGGEYITNNVYCTLTLAGEGFDRGPLSIVTPKQWLYSKDLDVHVLALRELGVLDNMRVKWFQSKTCPETEEVSTAMGVDATGGLFLTFAVICVLSLLLFVWKKRGIGKKFRAFVQASKQTVSQTND